MEKHRTGVISVRLQTDEKTLIQAKARTFNMSMSEYLRWSAVKSIDLEMVEKAIEAKLEQAHEKLSTTLHIQQQQMIAQSDKIIADFRKVLLGA